MNIAAKYGDDAQERYTLLHELFGVNGSRVQGILFGHRVAKGKLPGFLAIREGEAPASTKEKKTEPKGAK